MTLITLIALLLGGIIYLEAKDSKRGELGRVVFMVLLFWFWWLFLKEPIHFPWP